MGKNTTNDMTQGNCMRLLVQFFLPILAGNLFQQLYSFADSMVVGKGIGDTALAAVGNTGSVHFLIIGSRKNCSEILQCFRHQIFRCMEKCK